jgi:hypothetical protein
MMEVQKWRLWCGSLRLARIILPTTGLASGKIKLLWSEVPLPGEICNSVASEGEAKISLGIGEHPVGIIWKGAVKLDVISVKHAAEHVEGQPAATQKGACINWEGILYVQGCWVTRVRATTCQDSRSLCFLSIRRKVEF